MEETKIALLTDGRKIVLEDENDILLSFIVNGKTEYAFQVPSPSEGYGGGSLLLSPSEQYLLLSYFSGQSQEAFMLFCIDNCHLELFYESGYLYGEDANYRFLSDERLVLQTLRTGWWYPETEETDEHGDKFYEFGQINILNINARKLNRHVIRVYPSDGWEEDITDNGPFLFSEMLNDSSFTVIMPWGKEAFHYELCGTFEESGNLSAERGADKDDCTGGRPCKLVVEKCQLG